MHEIPKFNFQKKYPQDVAITQALVRLGEIRDSSEHKISPEHFKLLEEYVAKTVLLKKKIERKTKSLTEIGKMNEDERKAYQAHIQEIRGQIQEVFRKLLDAEAAFPEMVPEEVDEELFKIHEILSEKRN